jgi:hypothetical protein
MSLASQSQSNPRLNDRHLRILHIFNALAGISISIVGVLALIAVFDRNPQFRTTGFIFALYTM